MNKAVIGTSRLFQQDLGTKPGRDRRIAGLNLPDFVFANFEAGLAEQQVQSKSDSLAADLQL